VGGTNPSSTIVSSSLANAANAAVGDSGDADWECLAVLSGHSADVKCVQFAASHDQWGDGDEIVVSASYDETIRIWAEDAGDWYQAACIQGVHTSTIWTLTIAPSGTRIISGSADGSLGIYKCYSAAEIQARSTSGITNDAKGARIARAKAEWQCVGTLPEAHAGTVYSVDYASARASHGRIASGGSDNRLQIYREALTSTADQPQFILDASASVKGGDVNCVCWHPTDGSILASASDDGALRIWKYVEG
jgi:cytosolic iron-sulfur protein assembly protein CIAO1